MQNTKLEQSLLLQCLAAPLSLLSLLWLDARLHPSRDIILRLQKHLVSRSLQQFGYTDTSRPLLQARSISSRNGTVTATIALFSCIWFAL